MDMALSILVPSIPSRIVGHLAPFLTKLCAQAEPYLEVEILSWIDNKRRSIGHKRDDMVQLAAGRFLTFVDDDDDVSDVYVKLAIEAIRQNPDADVIVSDQECYYNGEGPFFVHFGMEFENEPMRRGPDGKWVDLKRKPVHCCIWRADLAKSVRFPDLSYEEDSIWAAGVQALVLKQVRIPEVMHKYRYDDRVTEGHDWKG